MDNLDYIEDRELEQELLDNWFEYEAEIRLEPNE